VASEAHSQTSVQDPPDGDLGTEKGLPEILRKVDGYQQSHKFLAIPVAVYKKFSDDEAGHLAALISYFAFLSVFPLLIVLATVVSRVLVNQPDLAAEVVSTAAGSFLAIGASGEVEPLNVSGIAFVVAVLVTLWSGLAVANSMQIAMNTVYQVPKINRPGLLSRVLRSLELLIIIGVGLPVVGILQGVANRTVPGVAPNVAIVVGVLLLDTVLIALAFRQSTISKTTWRGVLPGAVIAAISWVVLQSLAAWLLTSKVASAESNYGQFAVVIGLLFWFFLLAQITLYCAELNAVLSAELWPRSLKSVITSTADTDADFETYDRNAKSAQQAKNVAITTETIAPQDAAKRARNPES
jgi:membrane protein